MLNKVILVGRLSQEPKVTYTPSNVPVVTFNLAVQRSFQNNDNGLKETDFFPIVAWRKQAENVAKFIKKGSLVAVEGRLQTRQYDGKDGIKRYVTEVVADNVTFLETKKDTEARGNSGYSQPQQSYSESSNSFESNEEEEPIDVSSFAEPDIIF